LPVSDLSNIGPRRSPDLAEGIVRRLAQVASGLVVYAVLLFGSAGRTTWVWGWVYVAALLCVVSANAIVMSPELIAERGKKKQDAKKWDRLLTRLNIVPYLAVPVVAGLDERWHLSPSPSMAVHLAGLVAFVLGQALFTWAVASNRFFSTAVRIQLDRGHTVETSGPYAFVRHPGYAGAIVATIATAFILGSFWALLPAALVAMNLVVRTALEDRTLQAELRGYREYALRVRRRLLPGVW
jgi:protein-S-isoprenylcysteine O-methyltransferase Ste14